MFVCRKLIVDEFHELFDANGMKFQELKSDYAQVREYAAAILRECPEKFLDERILEQQLSEIIKNAIKHGNKQDPKKHLRVWYDFRNRVRFIVEDEGVGFTDLDDWNAFYSRRQRALYDHDFDTFLELASYCGKESTPDDGGNSLIAALEYWNGGMVYNEKKNKVGVVRWYTHGFSR